ncbi:MAG TPA: hypothetical protein VLG40_02645, partial [Candidatus Saccharimonas sp.]|nr:hypothetical protein [Candidatus Saccharimonas sp.]
MLDIRYIRQNPEEVQTKAEQKGYSVDVRSLLRIDDQRRELQQQAETVRQARNAHAETLKQGKPSDEALQKGRQLKADLTDIESKLRAADDAFFAALKKIPNMPLDYVPVGASEDNNVVQKTVGTPPQFDFEPKNHWQLGEAHDFIDKERAAKVAGSRFAYLKGGLVQLQ